MINASMEVKVKKVSLIYTIPLSCKPDVALFTKIFCCVALKLNLVSIQC